MNILFISYWGIEDGLTESTVIPHIKILSEYEAIDKIFLVTIERKERSGPKNINSKTIHLPLYSESETLKAFGQVIDFIVIPPRLEKHCFDFHIDKIIARGVLAGTLACKISKRTGIPFYIESYEPHADYMKETGVWSKWGIKYNFQKKWETKQLKYAEGIITVSNGYKEYLKPFSTITTKICTAPCAVDIEKFGFNQKNREFIRKKLGLDSRTFVGIYVGKFGGLYLEPKEIGFLNNLLKYSSDMALIILTPTPAHTLLNAFRSIINPKIKLIVKKVSHIEVPLFLSGADFALSLNKQFPSGRYLSPVKHGEYWANGLPILMTPGIGDESEFLEKEGGGVLFHKEKSMESLDKLKELIKDPDHRKHIPKLAQKYRSFDKVREAYEKLILPDLS